MSEKNRNYDLIIVGGGAAGLAAAVAFGRRMGGNARAAVIEKEEKPGRKLLATGNGRCNLTNINMSEDFYNENARAFVRNILQRTTPERLIKSFEQLGLICRTDDAGRVYPYANQASAVLDILMMWIEKTGVEVICGEKVGSIVSAQGYTVTTAEKIYHTKKLILASGGAVQKALGSDGSSYEFAKMLGLKCESVFPSLAPVIVTDKSLNIVKGVRAQAVVTACCSGKTLVSERGELQFNEKNISGICVFQLSRFVNEHFADKEKYKGIYISADLAPDLTENKLFSILDNKRRDLPDTKADDVFVGIINKKLGLYLCKRSGIVCSGRTVGELTDKELKSLADITKNCSFTPLKMSEYGSAQVTAGGISVDETDRNMRVKKYDGLYAVGEALDVDGMCGGYNLHFAFASGIAAGTAAAKSGGKKNDKNK